MPPQASAVDIELNFRLQGEIDRLGGSGSVELSVDINETAAAAGALEISGSTNTSIGVLSAVNPVDSFLINNGTNVDVAFSVPLSLEFEESAVLDLRLATTSLGVDVDFSDLGQTGGGSSSEGDGQGLVLESVTLAGGGSLASMGFALEFLPEATQLNASATLDGVTESQTGGLPVLTTSASGESVAQVAVEAGPRALLGAFAAPLSGVAESAAAELLAIRIDGVAQPNLRLGAFTALPGDYNSDGTIDVLDYTLWSDTFGDAVPPGEGADGNADGVVDAGDYSVWRDALGLITAAPALRVAVVATPEPAALGGALVASALVVCRGWRRR